MTTTPELFHLSQTRQKWVVVRPEAPSLYADDPNMQSVTEDMKEIGIQCLDAAKGMKGIVTVAAWIGKSLWYDVLLNEPVTIVTPAGVPNRYKFLRLSAEYVTIEDSGYMEAK